MPGLRAAERPTPPASMLVVFLAAAVLLVSSPADAQTDDHDHGGITEPTETAVPLAAVNEVSGTMNWTGDQTVAPGEVLRFDPNADTTLVVAGNLVVEGLLEMRPAPGVSHTLRFTGVDESTFVGGGVEVLATDRGLWVMGAGRLDIQGAQKAGWNRMGHDPTWAPSDELVVAPTGTDAYAEGGFSRFELGGTVPRASETLPPTEVLNLTRTVRIEGTPGHRAHVLIHSSQPQTIRFAEFRHMGPRQDEGGSPVGVTGRYPLHFHMSGHGSRGSLVEGNVVRQSGNRAFVTHGSHGVMLIDNVAYDVSDTPYWWDRGAEHATHDLTYEHNFAGHVTIDPPSESYTMSGFDLGLGDGNVANNNAAAGVLGIKNCSGFHWPSQGAGLWEFRGNVAHNNRCSGIFVWENSYLNHVIENFVAYRNGVAGVDHGAYKNDYIYRDLYLFENGEAGIMAHAFTHGDTDRSDGQSWSCVTVVGSPVAVKIEVSNAKDGGEPTAFNNLTAIDTPALSAVSEAALSNGQTLAKRAAFQDTNISCDRFSDDNGNVHERAIEAIAAYEVTLGCNPPENTRYCPSNQVRRGEMAAFLTRALDLPEAEGDFFADDGESEFEDSINRLATAGITKGCNPPGNTAFCADEGVTRGEMAAFLTRALHLLASGNDAFGDDQGSVFEADINALEAARITLGCNPPDNDRFCPTAAVLRDQMASFLARGLGYGLRPKS